MQLSRRILALSLALVMMFVMATASFAEFQDVPAGSPYKESIEKLAMLGLLIGNADGTFRPNDFITRGEFSTVMTRTMGVEDELAKTQSAIDVFTDLVNAQGQEHWASGFIKISYGLKIVAGMGDGTFAPDAQVTYEQVVKMIVCALGYEEIAIERGGWPGGYIQVANEKDITAGAIVSPTNQPATRAIVAKLIDNSLEVPIGEPSAGSTVVTKKTILTDKLKVNKLTNALVTAVDGVASITTSSAAVKEGQIMIETPDSNAIYDYGTVITSAAATDLLGFYVNAFFKYDSTLDKRNLISIYATAKNETTTVLSADVDSYDASGRRLHYWVNKNDAKPKYLTISSTAKLVYNGVAYDYANASSPDEKNLSRWLSPDTNPNFFHGEARFLDSGSDGEINVIFMYDYDNYVVKESIRTNDPEYANNYRIYDYYVPGKSIQVDPEDRDVKVSITNARTKAPVNIESIKPFDIISIAESIDGKVINCVVSDTVITGTVSEIETTDYRYTINNVKYELSPEFKAVIIAGTESIDFDATGSFYIDMFGEIAACKVAAAKAGNYAYLTRAGASGGVSGGSVELFKPGGSAPIIYGLADRVRYNGTNISDAATVVSNLASTANQFGSNNAPATNATYSQLVKYTTKVVNGVEQVDRIDTVSPTAGPLPSTSSTAFKLFETKSELTYVSSGNLSNKIILDSSTIIIAVPDNRHASADYKIVSYSSFFKIGNKYTVEAYDVYGAKAKVVLVYGDAAVIDIDADTPISIVISQSSRTSQNAVDGGTVFAYEVYENGQTKTYETESTDSALSVDVGDVVRFGFNNSGQINKVKMAQSAKSLVPKTVTEEPYESGFKFKTVFGTVSIKNDANIAIAPALVQADGSLDDTQREFYNLATPLVYLVNLQGGTVRVETRTLNDISEYGDVANPNASKVFAYLYRNELKTIVMYIQ